MRLSFCILAPFLVSLLLSTIILAAQLDSPDSSYGDDYHEQEKMVKNAVDGGEKGEYVGSKRGRTVEIAGSRLPDCSHACGSCSPCRLAMVRVACASHTDAAETCPVSYRCSCNSKSYPVP